MELVPGLIFLPSLFQFSHLCPAFPPRTPTHTLTAKMTSVVSWKLQPLQVSQRIMGSSHQSVMLVHALHKTRGVLAGLLAPSTIIGLCAWLIIGCSLGRCLWLLFHLCLTSAWGWLCWSMAGVRGKLRSGSGLPGRERETVFSMWVYANEIHRMKAKYRPGVPTGSYRGRTNGYVGQQ